MTRLQAQNLTLGYEEKNPIIHDLHLSIEPGRITVLVGPNGCGKSTLLRGLSRLLKPSGGSVYLDGRNIHQMRARDLACEIGILPQSPSAPEGLTVYELVAQGRYPHQSWLQQWSREDERITAEALAITNLSDLADRAVDTLSGGQRQRAWIAMALAQQSDILLLDEPTTFLDMAYQIEVLDLLADLNAQGRTIVMVLHDLNQAARYADIMIALRDGQIWAQGSPQEVMSVENIAAVFGMPCQIMCDPVSSTPLCVPMSRRMQAARSAAPALRPQPAFGD